MKSEECILALDFDGVIWDSVGESWWVARRTYERLTEQPYPEEEPRFREARWLARTGHDFYIILRLLLEEPDADFPRYPKERFAVLREAWREEAESFEPAFYAERDRMREQEPARWMALQQPYDAVVRELPQLESGFREVAITTTKDQASVRRLMASRGLDLSVLGKEFSRDKRDHVRHLAGTRNLPVENVVLVDDLLENLAPVQSAGARVGLATWGYNTPDEQSAAVAQGVALIHPGQILADVRHHILRSNGYRMS